MHRNFKSYLTIAALSLSGCAGGGAGSMRAAAPSAPGAATTAPRSALSITVSVPKKTKPVPSARRRPAYVSAGTMSIVFTLDQPELDDPDARHRTFEQDLQPGDNVIMIPSPDGSLTLTASTYDQTGGKGHELGYSDPQTITIDEGPPQEVDILLNPIIVTAVADAFDVQIFSLFSTETAECTGAEGQYLLTGADAAGQVVDGEGRFLDVDHNDVTVSAQGGFLVTSFTQIGAPGVSISTSSATEVTGGSFLDNVPEFDLPDGGTPAIIASASSANVAPSTTILAPVNNVNGVGCNVGSGG
jgi:hypothetical protein